MIIHRVSLHKPNPWLDWLKALVFVSLLLPVSLLAVDELGLFEIDENYADDAVTTDSCGWDLDGNTTVDMDEECPGG